MAGIGFELKKILKENKLSSILKVYGYSAILSSGPWVISILSVLAIGLYKLHSKYSVEIIQFQVSITYILALSLIISSFFQLSFSRYVANKIFQNQHSKIFSSYIGILTIVLGISLVLGIIFSYFFLRPVRATYMTIFISSLCVLSGIWIANSILVGVKKYNFVILAYAISYFFIFVISILMPTKNIESLLLSFFVGNSILFFMLSFVIIKNYHSFDVFMSFDFLTDKQDRLMPCLIAGSFFYNLGIWIDKFIFWSFEKTSQKIIANLSASVVYDLPIFLAYLSIIPGMAVFFYRLEADFAEKYENFYNFVREGGTLDVIIDKKGEMIETLRIMIREIITIQGIFNFLIFYFSPKIFELLKIPKLYLPLFYIDLISVQIQLGFLAILSVLHYLDKRKQAMWLSFLFLILNFILNYITVKYLGPTYFGYGFGLSVLLPLILSLIVLNKTFKDLEYETFMFI